LRGFLDKQNIVLGAGAAGLAAAWELAEKKKNVRVLERNAIVGGMISYVEKNGNKYEYGSHVFHTDNEELRVRVLELMKDRFFSFDRGGKISICFRGKYYRYPLNGIDILVNFPLGLSAECVWDFVVSFLSNKLFYKEPRNSAEVLRSHFGKKLYEVFFKDYTHKFWGRPCEELDKLFALERIPRSDVVKVVKDVCDALGIGGKFAEHNLTERAIGKLYYSKNGIHDLADRMANKIRENNGVIDTDVTLARINIEGGRAATIEYTKGGERLSAGVENIVSTIPLRYLIPLFNPLPPREVLDCAERLQHLPFTVCGLLVNKPSVRDAVCTYYRDCVFNRLSEPTAHGLTTIPENKTILLAEMTDFTLREDGLNTDADILKRVVDDIISLGLIKREEVEDSCVFRYREAYPIYHIGFQDDLKVIFDYLKSLQNVFTTGRQGLFRYVNTHATMQLAIEEVGSIPA